MTVIHSLALKSDIDIKTGNISNFVACARDGARWTDEPKCCVRIATIVDELFLCWNIGGTELHFTSEAWLTESQPNPWLAFALFQGLVALLKQPRDPILQYYNKKLISATSFSFNFLQKKKNAWNLVLHFYQEFLIIPSVSKIAIRVYKSDMILCEQHVIESWASIWVT